MNSSVDNGLTFSLGSVQANQPAQLTDARSQAMKETAQDFEAVFLSQMLKHAGLETAFGPEASAFSEILLTEISQQMASRSDFGFAEQVYEQLKARETTDAE